ncbi:MAG: hypothetical protein HY216_04485 [Candidatus Rokubacteria bacterium]|nr:hypothetical protein [Candidatus Rokubacteria bacterium]
MILGIVAAGARGQMMAPAGEPVEHGTKRAGDREVTLLTAPPLSPEQIRQHMPGMESMQGKGGMQGMGGMQGQPGVQGMGGMRGMGGMGAGGGKPTHWIGVIVRDAKDGGVVPNADVTLTAKKGDLTRTMKLMPMPGSYGANISLPEKGRYAVTVRVTDGGRAQNAAFDLDYR